jgi:hypothetical protein
MSKRGIYESEEPHEDFSEIDDDGRMKWLKYVILYATKKRGFQIWYDEDDIMSAASSYIINGTRKIGPYPNASGFGPSNGRFPAQDMIENKRKTAVGSAIKYLIDRGHLQTKIFDGNVNYASNINDDIDFSILDQRGDFGASLSGNVEENTARSTKIAKTNKDECTLYGRCKKKIEEWLSDETAEGIYHGARGGKRKTKTKTKKNKTKTKKNRSR